MKIIYFNDKNKTIINQDIIGYLRTFKKDKLVSITFKPITKKCSINLHYESITDLKDDLNLWRIIE